MRDIVLLIPFQMINMQADCNGKGLGKLRPDHKLSL